MLLEMVHLVNLLFEASISDYNYGKQQLCIYALNTHRHADKIKYAGRKTELSIPSRLAVVGHKGIKCRADGTEWNTTMTKIGQTEKRDTVRDSHREQTIWCFNKTIFSFARVLLMLTERYCSQLKDKQGCPVIVILYKGSKTFLTSPKRFSLNTWCLFLVWKQSAEGQTVFS